MNLKRITALNVLVMSCLLLASIVAMTIWKKPNAPIPENLVGVLSPYPRQISDFELMDHHGLEFARQRMLGNWSFVFFGYTSCPDICPTTLAVLSSMQKQLKKVPDAWADTQVVFVSVDPQRDTRENLATYMDFFNKEFLALSGSKAQIDEFAHQYNAAYIIEPETSPGQYLISHSAAIFLTDPEGEIVASFSMPHDPAIIASQFMEIRAAY